MKKGELTTMLPSSPVVEWTNRERMVRVKIVAIDPSFIPEYKTSGSVCCDLLANLPDGPLTLSPGDVEKVDCGFSIQLPPDHEALIRTRSGLACKGIVCAGGIIDSDFRGPVKVILTNTGQEPVLLKHKDRIAQMAVKPVWYFDFKPVDKLEETERGSGGFGSTGIC